LYQKYFKKKLPFPLVTAIIEVLNSGTTEANENSAATLFSLSMLAENKVTGIWVWWMKHCQSFYFLHRIRRGGMRLDGSHSFKLLWKS